MYQIHATDHQCHVHGEWKYVIAHSIRMLSRWCHDMVWNPCMMSDVEDKCIEDVVLIIFM